MARSSKKTGPGAPRIGEELLIRKSVGLPPEDWEKLEKIAERE